MLSGTVALKRAMKCSKLGPILLMIKSEEREREREEIVLRTVNHMNNGNKLQMGTRSRGDETLDREINSWRDLAFCSC